MLTTKRHGDWMQTYTGRQFWPLDPRADEVCIEDIAHALSLQCRFAGHCRVFYSVAEHSVRVSDLLASQGARREMVLWGLLHDASEAYLVDLPRPVKRCVQGYAKAEANVQEMILGRFVPWQRGLAVDEWTMRHMDIEDADNILLATEARDLMAPPPVPWQRMPPPLPDVISPWRAADAESAFLACFRKLGGQ